MGLLMDGWVIGWGMDGWMDGWMDFGVERETGYEYVYTVR